MRTPGLTAILGGPLGRHAASGSWLPPARWVYALATLAWLVLVGRHAACVADPSAQYKALCYTDAAALWGPRGIEQGLVPYVQTDLEYPVLTGGLIWLTRQASGLVPADDPRAAFLGVTAVALFVCFLALVAVHLRLDARGAALLAGSPLIITAGLINWDLLAVLLTSAALLAWARDQPVWAGVLVALGASAKFYPALLMVPILALCLRALDWPMLTRVVLGFVGGFAAVNLPVFAAAPAGWLHQWTFHAGRGADLGSIWYALELLGIDTPAATASRLLLVVGVGAVAALAVFARRRPRLEELAFSVVTWFCLVNVVYSPQYVVWLLPLLLLTRPGWRPLVIFTAAEIFYWWAVWIYLDGGFYSGDGAARPYVLAVLVRWGVQLWLVGRVVIGALSPSPRASGRAAHPDAANPDAANPHLAANPDLDPTFWRHGATKSGPNQRHARGERDQRDQRGERW